MKTYLKQLAMTAFAAVSLNVSAATYNDTIGDLSGGPSGNFAGLTNLDIISVEVNNTATDLIFKINIWGNPIATDWGKYMIALDTVPGGDTVGNGWGRPISMQSGMDYWVGTWVDSGNGAELRNYTGTWPVQSATYLPNPNNLLVSKDVSSVTVQFALAGIGLAPGGSFVFDVFSSGSGGGDSAVDALANSSPSIADWGNPYVSQSTLSYTIAQVPEPTALALLGVGASLVINRLRRR